MKIPLFWAESRKRTRVGGRQFTIRRFGWSDVSMDDAEAMADKRASKDLAAAARGEVVDARERKVPYNGAEGLPIREEVIAQRGESVLTRNSYGALCLNTPDVFFADIDTEFALPMSWAAAVLAGFGVAVVVMVISGTPLSLVGVALILALFLTPLAADLSYRMYLSFIGGPRLRAFRRISRFARRNPGWHLRVYETPAGYRVLAMHATFDPAGDVVHHSFRELAADPAYVAMCRRQRCFRARVSPKPWRAGVIEHIRPRRGVWPVAPHYLPSRKQWIQNYEAQSEGFASCRFVARFGSNHVHPAAESVRQWHDELSRAASELPLA